MKLIVAMAMAVAVAASCLVACGPSSGQIKTAKTAVYVAPPADLFRIAMEVAAATYKIGDTDEAAFQFVTRSRMYSIEGEPRSLTDGMTTKGPNSIELAFHIEVVEVEPRRYAIVITPRTLKYTSNMVAPQELAPDAVDLPGFVSGRVDTMAFEIYERAKAHASK